MFGQRKRPGRSTFMQDAGAAGSSAWYFGAGRMTNEGVDVAEGGYVSRRLLQLVMPVFPDRRMFRIHDPEVHPDAPGGPLPPIGVLGAATGEQLSIGSLQQDIDARLVLEEWDGQPLLPDAWDEEAKARLYLRGGLSIDTGTTGTASTPLRLARRGGHYAVRCPSTWSWRARRSPPSGCRATWAITRGACTRAPTRPSSRSRRTCSAGT